MSVEPSKDAGSPAAPRQERSALWRDRRFLVETALGLLIALVVYVQTERIAQQSADQAEALAGWTTNQENVRFVRETAIGDSLVMPFANLDISNGSFRGLHFGCTDTERETARQWQDKLSDTRYTGVSCKASFAVSNLESADFGGAQLYLADFSRARLRRTSFASANVSQGFFRLADIVGANFDRAYANRAYFRGSDLTGASFRNANLTYARFIDSNLAGADFSGAMLFGAEFENVGCDLVTWPDGYRPPAACR